MGRVVIKKEVLTADNSIICHQKVIDEINNRQYLNKCAPLKGALIRRFKCQQ